MAKMAPSLDPVLVVGAGIAGLLAARELRKHGFKAIVFEEGPVAGGRMATETVGDGRYDSGAQFFTVRERRFGELVEAWSAAGVAAVWSSGFVRALGRPRQDGHPRYRGVPTMDSIPRFLAEGLDVRLDQQVISASVAEGGWRLTLATGAHADGRALILTPPLPQSLELLGRGGYRLEVTTRDRLSAIVYDPCLALMVELDGASHIPPPGGLQLHGEPIAFIGDNRQKGVSPGATAVTIHGGPRFSEENWETADEIVAELLLDAGSFWIGATARTWQLRRWRYSIPTDIVPQRALLFPGPPGLVLAGDVFGGPRVEGAALSGIAAARRLLTPGG